MKVGWECYCLGYYTLYDDINKYRHKQIRGQLERNPLDIKICQHIWTNRF